MLVLNGTAEYTDDDGYKIKGKRYAFNMCSLAEDIDESIEDIGNYLGDAGWNEIDIKKRKIVPNNSVIDDSIFREAFNYALKNKFSIIVYGEPIDEKIKL